MSNDTEVSVGIDKEVLEWDTRQAIENVLKIHDAFMGRKNAPAPLHPEEVANLLQLQKFLANATKFALRRCLCNKVYCRNPNKQTPCALDPAEIEANPQSVFECRWRGKAI